MYVNTKMLHGNLKIYPKRLCNIPQGFQVNSLHSHTQYNMKSLFSFWANCRAPCFTASHWDSQGCKPT